MRPHRLKVGAFGAFAEEQEIDFDLLAQEGLFLIHGPTGAGKTTLLDSIVFALFGTVGDRGNERLVSHHVPPGTRPAVELEFSVGDRRYRVTRSPQYSAPKRGGGFTSKAPEASLVRLGTDGETPLASKVREVGAEIEGLIGLSAAQFSQIMLLPQGRFEQVLKARSDDRQQLLEKLFDTELYAEATRWLEQRAKDANSDVEDSIRKLATLVENASARRQALLDAIPGMESTDLVDGSDRSQWLATLVNEVEAASAAAHDETLNAKAKLDEATEARSEALLSVQRWTTRSQALEKLAELEAQKPAVVELAARLEEVDAALAIRGPLVEAQRTGSEASDAARAEVAAFDRLRTAIGKAAVLDSTLAQLARQLATAASLDEQSANEMSEVVTRAHGRVENLRTALREHARAESEQTQARSALEAAVRRVNDVESTISSLEAELKSINDDLATHKEQSAGLDVLQTQRGPLAERLEAASAAASMADEFQVVSTKASELIDRHQQAIEHWQQLREKYLEGIAADLASSLDAGAPCPVCGSLEHPSPALPADDAVTKEQVDAAEAFTNHALKEREDAESKVTGLEHELAVLRGRAGEGATVESLRGDLQELDAKIASATDAAEQAERLTQRAREISAQQEAAAAERNEATSGRSAAEATLEAARKQVADLETKLDELTASGLDATRLDSVDEALSGVEQAVSAARITRSESAAAKKRAAEAQSVADDAVDGSRFKDASTVLALLAGYDERGEHRDGWASRIDRHRKDLEDTTKLLASKELINLPEEQPSTKEVDQAAEKAGEIHERALERSTLLRSGLTDLTRITTDFDTQESLTAERRRHAELLNHVANRVGGKMRPKISLQRWVLRGYLEEICAYANQRLNTMTAGRYTLEVKTTEAKGNAQAGLDLNVFDAHTSQSRDVATLSGGETFQASLALALGVADTVSAHHGGIRLEALFVDEGFGSLDPESLQLAMDELDRLREGGRMVGLISHVGALRERISFGVEVVAGPSGSTARTGELAAV